MIQVGIIGVGLIGGSLGKALRRVKRSGARKYRVLGWGRSRSKLRKAKSLGALDEYSLRPGDVLNNADIVVLCVPVQKIPLLAEKVRPYLKPHAILTDVGSVKNNIVAALKGVLRKRGDLSFVGGHPLAGSEKTGINFARPDLFQKAAVVLTSDGAREKSVRTIRSMWEDAGAKVFLLKAARHDEFLALTSHLPHLLAFTLFSLVSGRAKKDPVLKSLVAGSFRDMTRIAGSPAAIWAGIIESNRAELVTQARKFQKLMIQLLNVPSKKLLGELNRLSSEKTRWTKK